MASIQEAVQMAKERAAAAAQSASTEVVEAYVPQGTNMAVSFTKPSMAVVAATTGVIPRNTPWLKVNEFGLYVGKNTKDFFDEIGPVEIDMTEDRGFMVKHTVKFGVPTQYLSTFDGVNCDKGGSWADAVARAKMSDPSPKTDPFPAVDVIFTLTQDLKCKAETFPAGTRVAYGTSKTAFNDWVDFYQAVSTAGRLGTVVRAMLKHREVKHNGQTWGVVTFELLED